MKRFPQGRGIIGALFLALLAACALFAWSEALPAAGDSRSIRSGDPALAVALLSGGGAADAGGMIAGRTDASVAPAEDFFGSGTPPTSPRGARTATPGTDQGAPASDAPSQEASFGILPWIVALLVILSVVLVVLALLPKRNSSH